MKVSCRRGSRAVAWRIQGSDGGFHICKGTEREPGVCVFRAAQSGSKQEV